MTTTKTITNNLGFIGDSLRRLRAEALHGYLKGGPVALGASQRAERGTQGPLAAKDATGLTGQVLDEADDDLVQAGIAGGPRPGHVPRSRQSPGDIATSELDPEVVHELTGGQWKPAA